MRITRLACASPTSSKSSSSIPVACLEKTLKFTPSRHGVAPRGQLFPGREPSVKSDRSGTGSIVSIFLTALKRLRSHIVAHGTSGHRAWFHIPDLGRVLRDGAVAGKPAGAGNVEDDRAGPPVRGGVQIEQPLVRIKVGRQVRQMHVMVAARQQGLAQRLEDTRLIAAEMV